MAFTSLFIGATGLTAYGDGMQVISNNLANVSTNGYKQNTPFYDSLISQQVATGSNRAGNNAVSMSQKGMGVRLADTKTSFRQGGLESTRTATEMALEGNGFFGVREADSGVIHYTRDGAFRFDNEGYLLSPQGYRVQGAAIDRETGGVGSLEDILLPLEEYTNAAGLTQQAVQSEPAATTSVSLSTNLDFDSTDQATSANNPFFAMFESWNAMADPPMADSSFTSQMGVYDADGNRHTIQFHFDEVGTTGLSNANPGYTYWEYALTMDPSEDGRAEFMGTSSAGMLAMGTLSFVDGQLMDMSAFTLGAGGDPSVLSNWEPSGFNAEGQPAFDVSFLVDGSATDTQTIGFDMGIVTSGGGWTSDTASNAGGVGVSPRNLASMENQSKDAFTTTNYNTGSVTYFANQDGYARGFLQSLSMDRDGTMVGRFTNGQEEGLFKVGVYRFNSDYGLHREGGNLFLETNNSGAAIEGFAEEGGRGYVNGSSLEMSNVDMAEQFVQMIVTQRGFQSNTKVITTSDSILNTAISIKR